MLSCTRLLPVFLLLSSIAGCGGSNVAPPVADPASLRTIEQGDVVGYAHPERLVHVWKGIPFAAPPVGDLRWRAPQPPSAWSSARPSARPSALNETREAIVPANECPQFDLQDSGVIKGDEDCLFLDVYAPRFDSNSVPEGGDRRPVMVWIHGGGNSLGSARVYDASRLVIAGDVIVVVIQYRLGVLGWFSHPALRASASNADDASGNFGTLDTIRALEWVRTNISAFGGDPGNVTIAGESAGGVDVFALLLSPRASGLFHRAIAQSGVLVSTPRSDAESFADANARHLPGSNEFLLRYLLADASAADRVAAQAAIASMSNEQIEAYLRGKSVEELLGILKDGFGGAMYHVPQVIRDGHVIVDMDPLEALATPGRHNAVPTIAGTNREETKLFALYTSSNIHRVLGFPVGVRDQRGFDLEGEYGGLFWKLRGSDEPLMALRAGGRSDVYGYRFDWDEQGSLLWFDYSKLLGAAHAVDLLFVFGFTDLGWFTDAMYADLPSAERLSAHMQSYWTHFAHTGSPGRGRGGDLPEWSAWGADDDDSRFLVFDSENGGGVRMANDVVTAESIAAKLTSDTRIVDRKERCALYRGFLWGTYLDHAFDYAAYQEGACAAWPIELPALPGE